MCHHGFGVLRVIVCLCFTVRAEGDKCPDGRPHAAQMNQTADKCNKYETVVACRGMKHGIPHDAHEPPPTMSACELPQRHDVASPPHTCATQFRLPPLSVGLQSEHEVAAFGRISLNRRQVLEVLLSAWSALSAEMTARASREYTTGAVTSFSQLLISDVFLKTQRLEQKQSTACNWSGWEHL